MFRCCNALINFLSTVLRPQIMDGGILNDVFSGGNRVIWCCNLIRSPTMKIPSVTSGEKVRSRKGRWSSNKWLINKHYFWIFFLFFLFFPHGNEILNNKFWVNTWKKKIKLHCAILLTIGAKKHKIREKSTVEWLVDIGLDYDDCGQGNGNTREWSAWKTK